MQVLVYINHRQQRPIQKLLFSNTVIQAPLHLKFDIFIKSNIYSQQLHCKSNFRVQLAFSMAKLKFTLC